MKKEKKKRVKEEISDVIKEHLEKLEKKKTTLEKKVNAEKSKISGTSARGKKEVKESKTKNKKADIKLKDVYGGKDIYQGVGSDLYSQITINPYVGMVFKSNVMKNSDIYKGESAIAKEGLGEGHIVSSEEMTTYVRKTTMNSLIGEGMFGIGSMNPLTVEEKEKMNFSMYDPTQKAVYLAEVARQGLGEKTMHAPDLNTTNKAK